MGSERDCIGGDATTWWSRADIATYGRWLGEAGMDSTEEYTIGEGDGTPAVLWLRRPPPLAP